jgi:hypothetical protein
MRTIDKIIMRCDTSRGAPMGRPDIGTPPLPFEEKKIYDCKVPMCADGAYDRGAAYWGIGSELRVLYTKDLSYVHFYRRK